MNDQFKLISEPFSAGYELIHNAEIYSYDKGEAIMDFQMFNALEERFGSNFVGYVGGIHYQFKPKKQIPRGALAIPSGNHDNPEALLVQK